MEKHKTPEKNKNPGEERKSLQQILLEENVADQAAEMAKKELRKNLHDKEISHGQLSEELTEFVQNLTPEIRRNPNDYFFINRATRDGLTRELIIFKKSDDKSPILYTDNPDLIELIFNRLKGLEY